MKLKLNFVQSALLVAGFVCSTQVFAAGVAINEKRAVSANEKIQINNMRGVVNIVAVDKAEFNVQGTLDEKAKGFDLTSKNGVTKFEVKMPSRMYSDYNEDGQEVGSRLEIQVPVGSQVEFTGVNADVTATGIQGGTTLTSVNGSVRGELLGSDVSLETVNGQIHSKNNNGRVTLQTVNGEIDDNGSQGRLKLESVNGEIKSVSQAKEVELSVVNGEGRLELDGTERLEFDAVNGDIAVDLKNSQTPKIEASTVSGSIKLTLDANVKARFELSGSAGGDIENSLTNDQVVKAKYGPSRDLAFSTGSGGDIEISTVSGEIELKKR
jgi:DUF4097 and DUF4098 domain-containing protein YvlB